MVLCISFLSFSYHRCWFIASDGRLGIAAQVLSRMDV